MVEHILQKSNKIWWCKVCHQTWKNKPRSQCPGIPIRNVIDFTSEVTASGAPYINRRILEGAEPIGHYMGSRRPLSFNKKGSPIYLLSVHTELIDPTLPPAYYHFSLSLLKKKGLITIGQMKQRGEQPKEGCNPVACMTSPGGGVTLFYRVEDTEEGNALQYITKTRLKSVYRLSDSWLKKLGDPDVLAENPHCKKAANMQLYLIGRVERFLKDNAEEYAAWLQKREVFVANAEPLRRYQSERQEIKEKLQEQHKMCLNCVYGKAFDNGIFCTVYPIEFPPDVPLVKYCPDYEQPKDDNGGDSG